MIIVSVAIVSMFITIILTATATMSLSLSAARSCDRVKELRLTYLADIFSAMTRWIATAYFAVVLCSGIMGKFYALPAVALIVIWLCLSVQATREARSSHKILAFYSARARMDAAQAHTHM